MRPRTRDALRMARAVEAAGGTVERTANGHLKVVGPSGFAIVGSSYGSRRSWKNAIADVRKHAGLNLKGRL